MNYIDASNNIEKIIKDFIVYYEPDEKNKSKLEAETRNVLDTLNLIADLSLEEVGDDETDDGILRVRRRPNSSKVRAIKLRKLALEHILNKKTEDDIIVAQKTQTEKEDKESYDITATQKLRTDALMETGIIATIESQGESITPAFITKAAEVDEMTKFKEQLNERVESEIEIPIINKSKKIDNTSEFSLAEIEQALRLRENRNKKETSETSADDIMPFVK